MLKIGDLSNTEMNRPSVVGGGRICGRSEPMVKYLEDKESFARVAIGEAST